MVDIENIVKSFNVEITYDKRDSITLFVSYNDNIKKYLKIDLGVFSNELYDVWFLNNHYFDEDEKDLIQVVDDILSGNYTIKSTIFKKKYIVTNTNKIGPERMYNKDFDFSVYDNLPREWSWK